MKPNKVFGLFAIIIICLAVFMPSVADQIVIPSGTTVIEDEAFFGDQSLTDLDLPEGLLRIGSKAFANTSLRSVSLPYSLEYFAQDAFDGCPEGFEISVYADSDAATLCSQYGINPKFIGKHRVGVSMPTKDLQRWNQAGELLKYWLEEKGYEVFLCFASNDVPTQISQIETMVDDGCEVVVIAAIEGSSLGTALDKAGEKGCKVIAYDRLLTYNANVDYYISFDNYKVGTVQGTYVKDALHLSSADGSFTMEFTAGDPGDNNAGLFFSGAIDVLRPYINSGKIVVKSGQYEFASVATPTWNTNVAQRRAEDILTACYSNGEKIDAWLCSNDSTALGVVNALEANYSGSGWPIITGQDCDIANMKNILSGKQSMSVFKDTRTLAAQAVKMVGQILKGEEVDVNDTQTFDNHIKYVPSFLCDPVYVDANNYRALLIDSGYYTEDQLGTVTPMPTLSQTEISITEPVQAGKNTSFSFSPVDNATSYSATFSANGKIIINWGSQTALPNNNLTIPGYWLGSGIYTIKVTASAIGYRDSSATYTFSTVDNNERPAPVVSVDKTTVLAQENFKFTVNTENANDLCYRIGNNNYTNRINVFEEETEFVTSGYDVGDFEYRFAVRRSNTWSEWSEPIVIHVIEEIIPAAPRIDVLSTLEEGRDLIVSLSQVEGATRYTLYLSDDSGSVYSNYSLSSGEINSINIPGYRLGAGSYTLSAYSYNGYHYSETSYKTIIVADGDRSDAPDVTPPANTTVTPNSYATFTIETSGADRVAARYFRPGYTNDARYLSRTVTDALSETTWAIYVDGDNTRKYSFSVRKNGVWSYWSAPITITVDENGGTIIPSGDGIKVGIINLDPAESGYREANVKDMQDTFTAEKGYNATFVTAPTADKQLEAAKTFITEGVKYILVSAAGATGWDEVLREAKDNGIGVFLFDRMIDCDPSLYTAAVVSDMAEEGKTAVAWLESLNLPEYRILHIKGQLGSAAQLGRSGALDEKCAADEKWTIVREGTGGDSWDPEEARKITQAAIDSGETFNVIYAENDGMALGAVEALDAAGITHGAIGDVIIMGFDCNKWALRKLLAGEWNYDGQCSPFQAGLIDGMIKTLEAGGEIEGLNALNQIFNVEVGFDTKTITQDDIDRYGLGE